MKITGIGKLLRIFVGEGDLYKGEPIYDYIVLKARESGIAGATVIKGIEGYGATSRIHTSKLISLNFHLPIIIEIVDTVHRIELIQTIVDEVFEESGCGGLITIEEVEIIKYAPGKY